MRYFVLAVIAIAVSQVNVNAATIIQTQYFSGVPAYSSTLTFNQFDPGLGTLNAVQVDVEITSNNGQLRLDNDAPSASSGIVSYGSDATISSTDVSLLNSIFQPVVGALEVMTSGSLLLDADDGDGPVFSLVGPDSGILAPLSGSASDSGLINTLFLPQFSGVGTFEIDAHTGQVIDFGAFGGVQFQGDPIMTNGSVTLTYHYSPVPSPSTLIGLSSLVLIVGSRMIMIRNRSDQSLNS